PLNGTVTKPGDDPVAISVGASTDNDTAGIGDDFIADFTSRGPTPDGLAKADLVAPATHIESLRAPGSTVDTNHPEARVGDEGFRGSGTSFAAPMVSGAAALMLSADTSLTPNQVKYGLVAGARPIDGDTAAQGSGTLRAYRALRFATAGYANQDTGRSNGHGSLNGSRGSMHVMIKARVQLINGVIAPTAVNVTLPIEGENIALTDTAVPLIASPADVVHTFDNEQFTNDANWNASQWGASQWGASQWGASQWGASQWGASQWGASQWWASQWG
ncbi:MAG: S8 family serine peptidase, partial [Thermoleophilia bacterium]|nr:S8 family serine peptidase [Thermoleophilia bacterium]